MRTPEAHIISDSTDTSPPRNFTKAKRAVVTARTNPVKKSAMKMVNHFVTDAAHLIEAQKSPTSTRPHGNLSTFSSAPTSGSGEATGEAFRAFIATPHRRIRVGWMHAFDGNYFTSASEEGSSA
jgi:hypothetical protein